MITCRQCKWWGRETPEIRFRGEALICGKIEDHTIKQGALAETVDQFSEGSWLMTLPDFGCVHGELDPTAPQSRALPGGMKTTGPRTNGT